MLSPGTFLYIFVMQKVLLGNNVREEVPSLEKLSIIITMICFDDRIEKTDSFYQLEVG